MERALAECESIDSRYTMMALRIGRIEAAMVWFEERQDKVTSNCWQSAIVLMLKLETYLR